MTITPDALEPLLIFLHLAGAFSACAFAVTKHRNGIGWFVIGGLYPAIGVILAIVLPAGEPKLNIPVDLVNLPENYRL